VAESALFYDPTVDEFVIRYLTVQQVARSMWMPTEAQIGDAGERIVSRSLGAKGWATNIDTKLPGSTDIEARGTNAGLLIQVKTAIAPRVPPRLSGDEERNVKARAIRLRWDAYEARVQVDMCLRLIGDIGWRKLT
jgi:hypothetical protein